MNLKLTNVKRPWKWYKKCFFNFRWRKNYIVLLVKFLSKMPKKQAIKFFECCLNKTPKNVTFCLISQLCHKLEGTIKILKTLWSSIMKWTDINLHHTIQRKVSIKIIREYMVWSHPSSIEWIIYFWWTFKYHLFHFTTVSRGCSNTIKNRNYMKYIFYQGGVILVYFNNRLHNSFLNGICYENVKKMGNRIH